LRFFDSRTERHDHLTNPGCDGSGGSLAMGYFVGMFGEQHNGLSLVEIEKRLHGTPTLEVSEYWVEPVIVLVQLVPQPIFREDTGVARKTHGASRCVAGALTQPKKSNPAVLGFTPILKIKAGCIIVAVAFQQYRQSFQAFAVHAACLVNLRTSNDNLVPITTR
jgi:hypothetical protein